MNLRTVLLFIVSLALLPRDGHTQNAKPSPAFPAVTIPNTEIRSLHSSVTGRDYDLYMYLPAKLAPGVKYPVLYLLDGQWDFKLLASIQGGLLYDKFVPDVIVVGITYSGATANYDSLRAVDYTPVASPSNPGSGNGAAFLRMLKTELLPFVETRYPIDPTKRALMGASLGGLFTLYAMFTEPALFAGYAAGSPAVTYANRGEFANEAAFAGGHTDLSAKLYVAVGDQEALFGPVQEFMKTLAARGYKHLVIESRVIAGERHSGNKPEGFNRGLRFLFQQPAPGLGAIERMDPALDALIASDARIEKLADGFDWAEGPVWRKAGGYLLFSDVPKNTIYKWQEGAGLSVFLRPSGYVGNAPPGRELGSNGLTFDSHDALVMADHGNRQVARIDSDKFTKVTLADRSGGKRLNSPNDLVFRSNGDLYFTDPPFGLWKLNDDPAKELKANGVYRLTPSGELTLLTSDLGFPNGIAFSPDEKTLYVDNADGARPIWMAYHVEANGSISNGRVLYDATAFVRAGKKGVPDGMKVDNAGNIFSAGPGGVLVLSPQGKLLGVIATGQPTANVAFGDDGSTLYITANNQLLRVRLKTKGAGF